VGCDLFWKLLEKRRLVESVPEIVSGRKICAEGALALAVCAICGAWFVGLSLSLVLP